MLPAAVNQNLCHWFFWGNHIVAHKCWFTVFIFSSRIVLWLLDDFILNLQSTLLLINRKVRLFLTVTLTHSIGLWFNPENPFAILYYVQFGDVFLHSLYLCYTWSFLLQQDFLLFCKIILWEWKKNHYINV